MKRAGISVPKRKLAEGLTKAEAAALEIATIAKLGREPNGPLVNATSGGDGVREPSPELRAAMSARATKWATGNRNRRGTITPPEVRAKQRAALLGRPRPDNSERLKGNTYGTANKGKPLSEETKAKMRDSAQRRAAEGRHHIKAGNVLSEETKAKIAAANRARAQDPAERLKISKALKGRVFSPEHLEKLRIGQKRRQDARRALADTGITEG